MTCSEFQKRIDPFLDNEVDLATAQEMQRHLEECADCETFFAARLALRQRLQTPELRFLPAADLRSEIHAQLQKEIRPPLAHFNWLPRLQFPNWILPTLAGAAAVLVFWFGSTTFLSPVRSSNGANNTLIEQLVSNHLRSLVGNHLFDVASSDQHTVKPWFAGKLNFSPPVFDFSEQGFKLIGGRLDYLAMRKRQPWFFSTRSTISTCSFGPGTSRVLCQTRFFRRKDSTCTVGKPTA
jgi:anti-sigma factor RsiW